MVAEEMPVSISCTKHLLKALCQRAHRKKNCNLYNTPSSTQIFWILPAGSGSGKPGGAKVVSQGWWSQIPPAAGSRSMKEWWNRMQPEIEKRPISMNATRCTWRWSHSIWHSIGQTWQRFTSIQTSSRYICHICELACTSIDEFRWQISHTYW